jgi:hypothetical protein
LIILVTGCLVKYDLPRSPLVAFIRKDTYLSPTGLSRPRLCLTFSRTSSEAGRPPNIKLTGSPGIIFNVINTTVQATYSVGITINNFLKKKFIDWVNKSHLEIKQGGF